MKKIILWVLMFFIYFIWQNTLLTFANTKVNQAQKELDAARREFDVWPPTPEIIDRTKRAEKNLEEAKERAESCGTDCIDMETFMIETSLFSDGGKWLKWENSKTTINTVLWTLIQKLMIALWVISLLIMTIGAGYMILYHGEDEYLSKWKSIITAGVIALIVSLSSYYMVNLLWYILYKM